MFRLHAPQRLARESCALCQSASRSRLTQSCPTAQSNSTPQHCRALMRPPAPPPPTTPTILHPTRDLPASSAGDPKSDATHATNAKRTHATHQHHTRPPTTTHAHTHTHTAGRRCARAHTQMPCDYAYLWNWVGASVRSVGPSVGRSVARTETVSASRRARSHARSSPVRWQATRFDAA